jgi:hypothetical protein
MLCYLIMPIAAGRARQRNLASRKEEDPENMPKKMELVSESISPSQTEKFFGWLSLNFTILMSLAG